MTNEVLIIASLIYILEHDALCPDEDDDYQGFEEHKDLLLQLDTELSFLKDKHQGN